jgi:hypothetical protein
MVNKQLYYCCKIVATMLCLWSIVAACNTDRLSCLEPITPQLNMHCYQHVDSNNTYIDTLLPNANVVSLDIDSALFWDMGVKGQAQFSIVLSPLHDSTRWVIQSDSAITPIDTLTFIYNRKLNFVSNACGYNYLYDLIQVLNTRHNIDSVSINNSAITTKAGIEHVKIFF